MFEVALGATVCTPSTVVSEVALGVMVCSLSTVVSEVV